MKTEKKLRSQPRTQVRKPLNFKISVETRKPRRDRVPAGSGGCGGK